MQGLLPIWKEKGMTSHDVVFRLRKILRMKKIGHTGTLDPDVEGVLLICLGEGTKLVELLMDGQKEYIGEITLGFATETEDASGQIIERTPVLVPVSSEKIQSAMNHLHGNITQIPPYYSAVKVNGKRLYEYARKGEKVERPMRKAQIDSFERISDIIYDETKQIQSWQFRVVCGKGTYVRTLAVDLGKALGYAAHMSALTRIATGGYRKEQAMTLEEVQHAMKNETIDELIYPIESALAIYPSIQLTVAQLQEIQTGKVLPEDYFGEKMQAPTVLLFENKAQAIYQPHPTKEGLIKPLRMFVQN